MINSKRISLEITGDLPEGNRGEKSKKVHEKFAISEDSKKASGRSHSNKWFQLVPRRFQGRSRLFERGRSRLY